ncbi:transmembrane protein 135 [Caerostris extrusa]|uniref:Transmembrane protein 135 n=1 Tax=Caerostris extrusa TaxID=172846 RepID=A0AAV4MI07_CAEEX|nr:transmembrane protein 135 [Caerostris extrusa]
MALLFHVLVFEAHNLKPAYLKFLSQVTHNKIGKFNRHLLELFGTQASKKYTDFWPPLDYRYTSLAFQETLMPWLIH